MASNMWNPTQDTCEVCGATIGSPIPGETQEDGESPVYLTGCTIEDDQGYTLTVCQECLGSIVRADWEELKYVAENGGRTPGGL